MECICGVLGEATALPIHLLRRLLAIEEQAKRVLRAEKWYKWACLAHLDAHLSARTRTEDLRDALVALNEASDALDAECHKLAEMVGEGDET